MSGQARFCTKCGAGLVEGTRFCTSCGTPVVAEPAPPAPPVAPAPTAPQAPAAPAPAAPSASTGEHVHAVIPNATLKAGLLGVKSKPYILVLTDRRVLFVQITKAMMKQLVIDARDEAKADGKGFFGQWGAQLTAYSAFAQRYLAMPPEQTLAETPGNFAIERTTIQKAKLKSGTMDENGNSSADRLTIKTAEKKYSIDLGSGIRQAKEALIAAEMI